LFLMRALSIVTWGVFACKGDPITHVILLYMGSVVQTGKSTYSFIIVDWISMMRVSPSATRTSVNGTSKLKKKKKPKPVGVRPPHGFH
jgi:hypothetical protein